MEAVLEGKSAELVQTTELLRASRAEEHVRSRSNEHEARRRAEDEGRGAVEEELRALKRKYVQLLETCESTLRALSPRWSAQPHQPRARAASLAKRWSGTEAFGAGHIGCIPGGRTAVVATGCRGSRKSATSGATSGGGGGGGGG